jgi:hypothetical protein
LNICYISKLLIVDRGSLYYNNLGGACFFFDIDVKGGESVVISRMLQWYNWMFFRIGCSSRGFKGLPSMPNGEIVGMFFRQRNSMCVCH